jgi:hypothetical protein
MKSKKFANTETKRATTLPPKGQSAKSPRGLGRDGNKPLMKNRTAIAAPSPTGMFGGNSFREAMFNHRGITTNS